VSAVVAQLTPLVRSQFHLKGADMTINHQFGEVDAHGATIRAQAMASEAEHQAIVRDVLAAEGFWGGAASSASQGFITGSQVQTSGSQRAADDSAIGSGWA
jgi:hypothetical protein